MCARVVGNISNSDYGKITNKILGVIQDKGAVKHSELTYAVRGAGMDRQVRGKALMDLLEGEEIIALSVKNGRQVTDWYGVSYQSVLERLTA